MPSQIAAKGGHRQPSAFLSWRAQLSGYLPLKAYIHKDSLFRSGRTKQPLDEDKVALTQCHLEISLRKLLGSSDLGDGPAQLYRMSLAVLL